MPVQKEVYDIITSLENVTGLGVCFYDLNRFFTNHYGALEKSYTGHYCSFCEAVRQLPGGRNACIKNDVINVKELAQSYKAPFFNICHIGLCECVVPVLKKDNLIGIVFIGQCRIESETNFKNIFEKIDHFKGDYKSFEKLFDCLPVISREQLSSAGKLADFSFKALVNRADSDIQYQQRDIVTLAEEYIASNFMNQISLSSIGNQLHINASYLSRKFKEKTGTNITDYITTVRIENAKKLLTYTKVPIVHISYNVGFTDQNYFSRVFKRIVSKTPQEFRKES